MLLLAALLAATGGAGAASTGDGNPSYRRGATVTGDIRISGSPADSALIAALEAGFSRHHPGARFSGKLHGPESTIAAVYTGVADIAFMARELRVPMETMAFKWAKLTDPFTVEIAHGGLDADRLGTQLAVFVHRDNPIRALSLTELDAILGAEHKRGPANIRSWGEVGLEGAWKTRPIRAYGTRIDSIPALFIRRTVMKDSRKWNADYREFVSHDAALEALQRDPAGIAFAPLRHRAANLRAVELSVDKGGVPYALTRETVIARSYPLTRSISVVLHRAEGQPLDPRVREFLRYILSADGQAVIARDGAYLPLSGDSVRRQLERLD
jgi:phosphate transport system substrate-binding protein